MVLGCCICGSDQTSLGGWFGGGGGGVWLEGYLIPVVVFGRVD